MKSKYLALLVAAALVLSLTAGCAGKNETPAEAPSESQPVQTEEIAPQQSEAAQSAEPAPEMPAYTVEYPLTTGADFTMVARLESNMQQIIDDFGQVKAMERYMENTGVNVEFRMIGDTVFSEQLNLLISSDDLPDMIQGSMAGYGSKLETAIEDEVLLDVAPLLEEFAPDYYAILQSDETFAELTYNNNGTLSVFKGYGLPIIDTGMYVRGDWMDALGLETPATLTQLTDVMRSFHSEYGTTMSILTNASLSTGLESTFNTTFNGFDALGFQLDAVGSGNVIASVVSQGFLDYMDYLRDIYAEGLICDDFLSISKQLNTYNSCYWNGDSGVWTEGNRCIDPSEYKNSADPDYQPRAIPRVTLDDGTATHVVGPGSTTGRGAIYITAACSDPQSAVSFMNYAYTQAGIDLCSFGIEGETFERVDEEHVNYTDLISANPDMQEKDAEVLYLVSNWMPTVQTKAMFNLKNSVTEVREAAELWTANCGDDAMCMPDGMTLSQSDSEAASAIANDILTLFNEKCCLYVMGDMEKGSLQDVIQSAQGMGLDEITEIYQRTYDEYMEKHGQ